MIREKQTNSGKLREIDYYPVWEDGRRMPCRAPKQKRTCAEQERYNRISATKKLIRLVNANFDTGDYLMHPTYEPSRAPQDEEQARKNIVNYLRRVKTKRASELRRISELCKNSPDDLRLRAQAEKLAEPFRYIYVIEKQIYKTGVNAGRANYHYHMFMTGGIDRDTLEDMWKFGARTNVDRFRPEIFGPEAAAKYMSKSPETSKRFICSKNLKKPEIPEPKDGRISVRGVEKLAKERCDDREYWERKFKGYRFIRCYSRYNSYNGNWYVSVVMYKSGSETMPKWEVNEWIEDYYN